MNAEEIFEKGKELAKRKGNSSRGDFSGGYEEDGSYTAYSDDYSCHLKKFDIEYSITFSNNIYKELKKTASESVTISFKNSFFNKKKKVYSFYKNLEEPSEVINVFKRGKWEEKLEKLARN